MKTILKTNITVKDICDGFIYNELEGKGLFGLSGKLTIQPEYISAIISMRLTAAKEKRPLLSLYSKVTQ